MAGLVRCLRRAVICNSPPPISCGTPRMCVESIQRPSFLISRKFLSSGSSDVSEMQNSANILRLIRSDIQSVLDHSPPVQPEERFGPFTVDDRPGERWITLRRKYGEKEDIKIKATMYDGAVSSWKWKSTSNDPEDVVVFLPIPLIINISKESDGETIEIICNAWPDTIEINKFFVRKTSKSSSNAYIGPDFDYWDTEDQFEDSFYHFLEERDILEDLGLFLNQYMKNKGKAEYIRWMETLKSFVEQK